MSPGAFMRPDARMVDGIWGRTFGSTKSLRVKEQRATKDGNASYEVHG